MITRNFFLNYETGIKTGTLKKKFLEPEPHNRKIKETGNYIPVVPIEVISII